MAAASWLLWHDCHGGVRGVPVAAREQLHILLHILLQPLPAVASALKALSLLWVWVCTDATMMPCL